MCYSSVTLWLELKLVSVCRSAKTNVNFLECFFLLLLLDLMNSDYVQGFSFVF